VRGSCTLAVIAWPRAVGNPPAWSAPFGASCESDSAAAARLCGSPGLCRDQSHGDVWQPRQAGRSVRHPVRRSHHRAYRTLIAPAERAQRDTGMLLYLLVELVRHAALLARLSPSCSSIAAWNP